jgi:ATP-dependent helicase/nuclease subunit B
VIYQAPLLTYTIVSVTVSYDSLVSFLDTQQVDSSVSRPTTETTGLCLLAGGIVGGNLEDELARQGISTDGLAVSTIEETARQLVGSTHRRQTEDPEPVAVLDQQLCEQLLVDTIADAPNSESLDAVATLLSGLDFAGRPSLRETLWSELDRYFRMTDAGRDHDAAIKVALSLAKNDPYAGARSQRALAAFAELHTMLRQRTESLPESAYLSRSHLVRAAREALATEWQTCFPDVDWVAVSTISVLDNPTLRFFETLATLDSGPDLYVFGTEAGAGPTLCDRLAATSLDPDLVGVDQRTDENTDQPHVSALMETVGGEPPTAIPNVEFVEAPDGRRELAAVAERIRELTATGVDESPTTTCGEIVIAAKDVIPYRGRIADVFTTHSIPIHIEARQPLMQTVPYRYLTAVFDLLAAVAADRPVAIDDLVDPLQLGFCLPESARVKPAVANDRWPMAGDTVAEIERRLEQIVDSEQTADGQRFEDWVDVIRAEFPPVETPTIHTYIEWVAETAATAPESPTAVVDRIESLLDAHLTPLTSRSVRRATGPGVDGTRTGLPTKHDSHVVSRLRDQASRVGSYVEQAVDTGLGEPGWELATDAVKNVCGSASYWTTNVDGNAVRIINAANAHFVAADHVFVIGLAAEEFPADRSPPTFFHEAFYQAVRETAHEAAKSETDSELSYLHAPTNQAQFEQDIDEYRAAVATASESVWLCRQFTTTERETVPWSGFVDAYISQAEDDEIHRISMGEWLPGADSDGNWTAAIRDATPRDRLRLLSMQFPEGIDSETVLRRPASQSLSDPEEIAELFARADGDAFSQEIDPRRRRYLGEDLQAITVDPDDPMGPKQAPAGSNPTTTASQSLADLTGPPIRLSELDLYANCQLKFYFYQYLDGGGTQRDRLSVDRTQSTPASASDSSLPTLLRERYPSHAFSDGLRRLITSTDRLADRQVAFSQYDSLGAFRDQLASWIETDRALDESLMQPMLGEYQAVKQELAAGGCREWRWEPATTMQVGGHEVRVPGHRVDSVPDTGIEIPVWYTGAEGAAKRLVAQSLQSKRESPGATNARDHRLLLGAESVDTFGGTLVYDPTSAAASEPHGILIGDLNPIPGSVPSTANLTQLTRSGWQDAHDPWLEATADHLESMTAVDEPITYRASESFVDNGGCAGCRYRELCQVPASHKRGDR